MTLKGGLIIAVFVLVGLPLGVGIVIARRALTADMEARARRDLSVTAEQSAAVITTFLRQRQSDIRVFSIDPLMVTGDQTQASRRLRQLSLLGFFFDALYVTDARGQVVAATDDTARGRLLVDVFPEVAPYVPRLLASGGREVEVSDLTDLAPGQGAESLRLSLLTPVLNSRGQAAGVMLGLLGIPILSQEIIELDRRTSGDEAAFLLARDGRILFSTGPTEPLQRHPDWERLAPIGSPIDASTVNYEDARGRRLIAGLSLTSPVGTGAGRPGEWIVMTVAPYADVMAPAFATLDRLTALLVSVVGLVIGAGLLVTHRLTRPGTSPSSASRPAQAM